MIPGSPAEALGPHAPDVSALVIDAVRSRHARFAEAHQVSGSRYAMGFGSQWRDLLDDVQEALAKRGYRTYKLPPAGYKLPVVNDCLVYVWRVPGSGEVSTSFASSPTRLNGFSAQLLDPTLFEPGTTIDSNLEASISSSEAEFELVVCAAADVMPLVLVTVRSSPRQLQSVEWAVAELDQAAEEVKLHGRESIWEPEVATNGATSAGESFDSGTPEGPMVEPREQEGADPDAR